MNSIQLLEAMSALSARMVESARANDWDQLVEQEAGLAALRRQLVEQEALGEPADRLSPDEQLHKAGLIERILADDTEIRSHADPWLDSARRMLSSDTKGRAMKAAYGSIIDE